MINLGGLLSSSQFLPRDALVHSAVLRLHVVRPSVRLSVFVLVSIGTKVHYKFREK